MREGYPTVLLDQVYRDYGPSIFEDAVGFRQPPWCTDENEIKWNHVYFYLVTFPHLRGCALVCIAVRN